MSPPPLMKPSPPNNIRLSTNLHTSMLSLASPTKTQPRTNPYFSLPKSPKSPRSPKSEFGPWTSHVKSPSSQIPPPLPANRPGRPFQPSSPRAPQISPDTPVSSLSVVSSPQSLPQLLQASISPPAPPSPVKKSPFNPFLTSPVSSSCPPVKAVSNPFRAPLSSLPPKDPEDSSQQLGVNLFSSLLLSSGADTTSSASSTNPPRVVVSSPSSPRSTSSPCVKTNNVSDPLTAPPSNTLPPTNRKVNLGPAPQSAPAGDKYSALKELDDLFRTTVIAEPQPEVAPPSQPAAAAVGGGGGGGLFGNSLTAPPVNILSQTSPSNGMWASSPSGAGGSTWGQPARTSPMWTPQWSAASGDPAENSNTNTTG